jgi:hypothetical protein
MKCLSQYHLVEGDGKGCKEVVLKEFGVCYKHFRDLCETLEVHHCVAQGLTTPFRPPNGPDIQLENLRVCGGPGVQPAAELAEIRIDLPGVVGGLERASAMFRRVCEHLETLVDEAQLAKRENADLYQRKNKLIPKFQEMRRFLAVLLDKYDQLPKVEGQALAQERTGKRQRRASVKASSSKGASASYRSLGASGGGTGKSTKQRTTSPALQRKASSSKRKRQRKRASSAIVLPNAGKFWESGSSPRPEISPFDPPSVSLVGTSHLSLTSSQDSFPIAGSGDNDPGSAPSSPLSLPRSMLSGLEISESFGGSDASSVGTDSSAPGLLPYAAQSPIASPIHHHQQRHRLRERSSSTPAFFSLPHPEPMSLPVRRASNLAESVTPHDWTGDWHLDEYAGSDDGPGFAGVRPDLGLEEEIGEISHAELDAMFGGEAGEIELLDPE